MNVKGFAWVTAAEVEALGSAGRRGLALRGTDRILRPTVLVVPIRLVSHHLLRAVAQVRNLIAGHSIERLGRARDVSRAWDWPPGSQPLPWYASRFRAHDRSCRFPDGRPGCLRVRRTATGLGCGSGPCLGVHASRLARRPHGVPACGVYGGHHASGRPVVCARFRGSASCHLPRGLFHSARSWPWRQAPWRRTRCLTSRSRIAVTLGLC